MLGLIEHNSNNFEKSNTQDYVYSLWKINFENASFFKARDSRWIRH